SAKKSVRGRRECLLIRAWKSARPSRTTTSSPTSIVPAQSPWICLVENKADEGAALRGDRLSARDERAKSAALGTPASCYPLVATHWLRFFCLPTLHQQSRLVEAPARDVVHEQLQRAGDTIGDKGPGAGGTVKEPLWRDAQPVLAGVEAVEPAALL